MIWRIDYVVDDGYAHHKRMCIINEESREKALKVFDTQIKSKLKGERFVCDESTKITLCDDRLVYDGSR